MQEVKFKGALNLQISKGGAKPATAVTPGITIGPTVNKMVLNHLATKAMGINDGDYVIFFVNADAENVNEKYYFGVTSAKVADGQGKIAFRKEKNEDNEQEIISEDGHFTYSGVFSNILRTVVTGDVKSPDSSLDALRYDKLIDEKTALYKIVGDVVKTDQTYELGEETIDVYAIVNIKSKEHEPKTREIKK